MIHDTLPLWQYRLWSFQTRGMKLERFLPKNQHTQRKLLNFENRCNGEVSKSAKIWLSKSIFYVKNHWNLSQFFFHWRIPKLFHSFEEYQFRRTFFVLTFLDNIIFKITLLLWYPIFDNLPFKIHEFLLGMLIVC